MGSDKKLLHCERRKIIHLWATNEVYRTFVKKIFDARRSVLVPLDGQQGPRFALGDLIEPLFAFDVVFVQLCDYIKELDLPFLHSVVSWSLQLHTNNPKLI